MISRISYVSPPAPHDIRYLKKLLSKAPNVFKRVLYQHYVNVYKALLPHILTEDKDRDIHSRV